jgi:hypothetical protein
MSGDSRIGLAETERAAIRKQWAAEFDDGARCGFSQKFDGPRELGGYPKGFHAWPLARRNAWYAGFNKGNSDRRRSDEEGAADD